MFSNDKGSGWQAQSAPIVNPLQNTQTQQNQANQSIDSLQNFVNALQSANGVQNLSNVYNQLGQVAQGQGPNPAQAMLNNATGQNIANQAALMAGQRGASANPALIARQAAQQGANLQQQAIGQGAALQAQQALNALGQQGQIANQQVNQQENALGQLGSLTQGNLGQHIGANNALNQANVSNIAAQNNANSSIAQGNQKGQQNLVSNITSGIGSLGSLVGLAEGGEVEQPKIEKLAPLIKFAPMLFGAPPILAEGGSVPRSSYAKSMMAKGGKVDALVSPGEIYLPPEKAKKVAEGKESPMSGEKIPGKPKVPGAVNSNANDTVPRKLEEGGIVIPRSITQRKDAPEAAKRFVEALMNKKRAKK